MPARDGSTEERVTFVRHSRHHQRDAACRHQHRHDQLPLGAGDTDREKQKISTRCQQEGEHHEPAYAEACDQSACDDVHEHGDNGHRQEGDAGFLRQKMLLQLEEQAEDEDQAVIGEVDDDAGDRDDREGGTGKER